MTTANINSAPFNSIDTSYPIAGQDNDSQGFRTNYVYIQQSFQAANVDITGLWANVDGLNSNVTSIQGNLGNIGNLSANVTSLQSNVSTLQGDVSTIDSTAVFTNVAVNDMGGNVITGVAQRVSTGNNYNPGDTITLDYSSADFHQWVPSSPGSVTVAFSNWPSAGVYAKMELQISVNSSHSLTFDSNVILSANATNGGSLTVGNITTVQSRLGSVLTSLTDCVYLFEFSTFDSGAAIRVTEKSVVF